MNYLKGFVKGVCYMFAGLLVTLTMLVWLTLMQAFGLDPLTKYVTTFAIGGLMAILAVWGHEAVQWVKDEYRCRREMRRVVAMIGERNEKAVERDLDIQKKLADTEPKEGWAYG